MDSISDSKEVSTQILVFRTNIKTKKKVKIVKPLFNNQAFIKHWNIDTEDIDNVLRVEAKKGIDENDIVHLLKTCGFYCEALED